MTICLAQGPTATWTSTTDGKHVPVGSRLDYPDNRQFIAIQASEAITQYQAVGISEAYAGSKLTKAIADDSWKIGVAAATMAANAYGWVQVRGVTSVSVLASCAADAILYTTATAGSLDDTSTSQTKVAGIVVTAANTDTTAAADIACFMAIEPFADR